MEVTAKREGCTGRMSKRGLPEVPKRWITDANGDKAEPQYSLEQRMAVMRSVMGHEDLPED